MRINYPEIIEGVNENGEWVSVKIYPDKIESKVLQSNNWYRINIYWKDGTEEELYEKNK